MIEALDQLSHQWQNMGEVFDRAGTWAKVLAHRSINTKTSPSGQRWQPAAAPQSWPLLQRTGDLQSGIMAGGDPDKPTAFSIRVKSTAWYWYFQQYGTHRTGGARVGRRRRFRKTRGQAGFQQRSASTWDETSGWFRRVAPPRQFLPVDPRAVADRRMQGGAAGAFWRRLRQAIAAWLAKPGGDLK